MDNQKLGIFITELRKEKGLTQAQLAQKLNVTDKAVSKWERGVGQVKAELDAEESDYNYSISCALGKIKINDNSMGTFASEKTIQHANARGNIALECGLGNIHVTTRV